MAQLHGSCDFLIQNYDIRKEARQRDRRHEEGQGRPQRRRLQLHAGTEAAPPQVKRRRAS